MKDTQTKETELKNEFNEFCFSLTKKEPRLNLGEAKVRQKVANFWFDKMVSEVEQASRVTEDTSDGYHTFKELYEFRKLYNAAFFNELYTTDFLNRSNQFNVHKSKRHNNGEECFGGGWFIVMATLPTGQISNHYELKDWDLFHCEEREEADRWDGHSSKDVTDRLTKFLTFPSR